MRLVHGKPKTRQGIAPGKLRSGRPAEVAEMTRLSEATLRYWRYAGSGGPQSVKPGRRVMYRRVDVEKWLQEAQ